jgi:two-component system KDP operon response regulator KdpE
MRAVKANVLAVEDDPIVRADLRLILEDADFVVTEARDGAEAVEVARRDRPDLVLLDLGLPTLDGVSVARRILRHRRVPIVVLTGRSNSDGQARALRAGATDVVLKPFRGDHLVATLRGALETGTPPGAAFAEDEDYRMRALVEAMVARGCSQREIERALRRVF